MTETATKKTGAQRMEEWDARHRQEPWFEDWVRLRAMLAEGRVPEARVYSRELARQWPDVRVIQHYADAIQPPKVRTERRATGRPLERDYAWLREHAREYAGCWISVYDGRFIAADPDLDVVTAAARRKLGEGEASLVHFEPPTADEP
jgi:hypothetical protein